MLIRLYFMEYTKMFFFFLFLLWKIYDFRYNVNNEKDRTFFFVTKFITLIYVDVEIIF